MLHDMPVTLRFPFVFAIVMSMVIALTAIAAAVYAPSPNALVPISLCFTSIAMLCGVMAHQNKRIVDLDRRLCEVEQNRVKKPHGT